MKASKWLAIALAFLAAGCETSNQNQVSSTDPQALYASTDDAMDDLRTAPAGAVERLDAVISQLEAGIAKHPDSALLESAIGRAFIIRDCSLGGNDCSARAKKHLARAIELDPKLIRAQVLLAHDAMNSGCMRCKDPYLQAATKLDVNNPYVQEVIGRSVQLLGYGDLAELNYQRALDAFPAPKKRWQVYTWLSQIYKNRDDYVRAEDVLVKALEACPDGAWSVGNLGTFYIFSRGDYDKALPLLRKALGIMNYGLAKQGLTLALYERWADAYFKKADPGTVEAYWEDAQRESPDALSMFFVSASYAGTGRAARALFDTGKVPQGVLEQQWSRHRTPLVMAAWNDNTDLAVYLLEHGANPNAPDDTGMFVPHVAGSYANLQILEALARKNADLKALTSDGDTVLMRVAKAGTSKPDRIKAAALLIDKGVSIETKSEDGSTALGYAIRARDVEMVRYLLSRGARVNVQVENGVTPAVVVTPAVLAIIVGDREILQLLMNNKNVDLKAKVLGMTLTEFAVYNNRPEMAEMLRSHK